MASMLISEILKQVNDLPVQQEKPGKSTKRSFLRKHKDNAALKNIMWAVYNENVKFPGLDKGIGNIQFKKDDSPEGLAPSTLAHELKQMRFFVENHPEGMKITNKRRLELLINMLEVLHADEVAVVDGIFQKDLKIDGLTKDLVLEVWPDLLPKE